jgi:protein TonB
MNHITTHTMTFGEMEFDTLLQSVMQDRRAEAQPRAGMEQRLLARLAQEPQVAVATPFGFAERARAPRSSMATWFAVGAHAVALLVLLLVASQHRMITAPKQIAISQLVVPVMPPPIAPSASRLGGGGGHHDPAPASQGHLPKFAQEQLLAPKLPPPDAARLAVEPSVVVQKDLNMADNTLPNLGLPNSSAHGVSLGNGSGTGIGSGDGAGLGPGSGGNTGGGVYSIGGGVSRPVLVYEPQAEFSEEARKAKFSGNVEVQLWVDEKGMPSHIRVIHGVGMGLDDKAIEAVRQYRFKPAMKDGKPVTVDIYVDVNFQIL